MKKIYLFLVFYLAFYGISFSQFKVGFKGGLNLSTISKPFNNSSIKRAVFFNLGIMTRQEISKKLYFSPQLLFSEKGYSVKIIPSGTMRVHLNYISAPFYLGYKFSKAISIQAGPEVSYLLSGKDNSKNATDFYNKLEVSISGGLNFKLTKLFHIELLYDHGLTNIMRPYGIDSQPKGMNSVIQINVAYFLK